MHTDIILLLAVQSRKKRKDENAQALQALRYWSEESPAIASIHAFVSDVTDPDSERYIASSDRIAVFDFDGTLYGERFPTYFDTCLFLHRMLHDESYTAEEDVLAYAVALETALLNSQPEPDSPRSSAQMAAETFRGFMVDEIGKAPLLVFGNRSGDFAMAQYTVQRGGRAYMLLCDDTQRDWGDAETAAAIAETCASYGYETISMRDDFVTIYGEDTVRLNGA